MANERNDSAVAAPKYAQARARLSGLQMSPRKVRLVADMIRGKRVADARDILQFTVKGCAEPLRKLLDGWNAGRRILWADESLVGPAQTLAGLAPGPWAILIGPEGGFSEPERTRLRAQPFVTPISLGPRILRADTAACAAITLWQSHLGDWR